MREVLIRDAALADAEAIDVLFLDELEYHVGLMPDRFCVPEHIHPEGWLEELLEQDNKKLFLALVDGVIAGLILVRIDEFQVDVLIPRKFVCISEVSVLKAYRGQGVGQTMMRYVEAWAAEQGITELELNVWASNTSAKRFYERMGYEVLNFRMIKKL